MVKEVVVKDVLTEEMIRVGKAIILWLDNHDINITDAFWLLAAGANQWRLVLATPKLQLEGPKKFYKRIQSGLSKLGEPKLSLKDIYLLDSRDSLVRLFRRAILTGPGISDVRFTRNVVNGVPIEDAYIYRLS